MNGNELATEIGVTYRQVDHWSSCGYLRANELNPGQGNRRHYPPREVRAAHLMADLVDSGVDPAHAAVLARRLIRNGSTRLSPTITINVEVPA